MIFTWKVKHTGHKAGVAWPVYSKSPALFRIFILSSGKHRASSDEHAGMVRTSYEGESQVQVCTGFIRKWPRMEIGVSGLKPTEETALSM